MLQSPGVASFDASWTLWRWVCVRGAGLAVDGLAALASESLYDSAPSASDAEWEQRFDRESERLRDELKSIASTPRFRAALAWQNRAALRGGVAGFLRQPSSESSAKARRRAQLVASYVQRYCGKNDTIGFFGPIGWARFDGDGHLSVRAGKNLLDDRRIFFECWAIQALADAFADNWDVQSELAPRVAPTVVLEGRTLRYPVDKTRELAAELAAVLALCDGRPATEIASTVSADAELQLNADDVFELLALLTENKVIHWALEIPTMTSAPEVYLRQSLEALPSGAGAIAALDEIEGSRAAVSASSDDPEALDSALAALDETFERHAKIGSTRRGGEAYAGRTVIYEDCSRDVAVELGRAFEDKLADPLSLVLTSARWFSHEIGSRYRKRLCESFSELAGDETQIDYLRFWERNRELFASDSLADDPVASVVAELQARWARLLDLDDSARVVKRSAADLRERVAEAFSAPAPGWPSARHHSPDLLVAAASAEAAGAGDYQLVLGELHAGMNTLTVPFLAEHHPDRDALIDRRERELPVGVGPVKSKNKSRAEFYSLSRHDYDVDLGGSPSARPPEQVLPVGSLVVHRGERSLEVRSRGGGPSFDIIAFFDQYLIAKAHSSFEILPPRDHLPRVAIDDLVVWRERWCFEAAALKFASARTPSQLYRRALAWQRDLAVPRRVFAKVDNETKPLFVDFASPVLVEVLSRALRGATSVVITEMLPNPDECWLPDAEGNRYTSELRMVAVDPIEWSAP